MAKKRRKNLSPAALSRQDIRKVREVAAQEFSNANRRIKRLKESGLYSVSPAIAGLGNQAKFSSKGLTKDELIVEIQRARQFMRESTSTVKGARRFQLQMEYRPNELSFYEKGLLLSNQQWKKIHEVVKELNDKEEGVKRDPSEMIHFMVDVLYRANPKHRPNQNKLAELTREYIDNSYKARFLTLEGNW